MLNFLRGAPPRTPPGLPRPGPIENANIGKKCYTFSEHHSEPGRPWLGACAQAQPGLLDWRVGRSRTISDRALRSI